MFTTKFMFIILSIYSKNTNSLTNFLKFFYKLERKKALKLKLYTKQSKIKKNFSFISVLQSPHVNKKSQEQFGYNIYSKQLKIWVSQPKKLLSMWKLVKEKLFFDIQIKFKFLLDKSSIFDTISEKINCEKFMPTISEKRNKDLFWWYNNPKFRTKPKKKKLYLTNTTKQTFLKVTDIKGEALLRNFQYRHKIM